MKQGQINFSASLQNKATGKKVFADPHRLQQGVGCYEFATHIPISVTIFTIPLVPE